jgi:hypothetical protein
MGCPGEDILTNQPAFFAGLAVPMGLRFKQGVRIGRDSKKFAGRDAGAFEGIK